MDMQRKLNSILEQQQQGLTIKQIAENLETTEKGIRGFMRRQGYMCKNGEFIIKETTSVEQNTSEQLCLTEGIATVEKQVATKKKTVKIEEEPKNVIAFVAKSGKKTGVLEVTPEFFDLICELRDWYNEVKDLPQLKHKITKKNKTVIKDDPLIEEPLSKRINTDKELWDNLTILSENSGVSVNELATQAIKNLLKDYKHLV